MNFNNGLLKYYTEAKSNKWFINFATFCRISLALGFIPSGYVKIIGERFASGLSSNHPMGDYLEALYHTNFYYTFIGIAQLTIAVLLLIPRTVLLGAILYFPVILNICILTYATRFEGTRITTFMVLANFFLLCWHYDRLKYIFLPKNYIQTTSEIRSSSSNKFPFVFFAMAISLLIAVVIINQHIYSIRPGNAMDECKNGCPGNSNPAACEIFCDCIHIKGRPLKECLKTYHESTKVKSKNAQKE
jgi:uncharacterized membrane protein YphA (DoxX/SURF4 family)